MRRMAATRAINDDEEAVAVDDNLAAGEEARDAMAPVAPWSRVRLLGSRGRDAGASVGLRRAPIESEMLLVLRERRAKTRLAAIGVAAGDPLPTPPPREYAPGDLLRGSRRKFPANAPKDR